ncbi:short-chain dehydrogenase/reductase SDR [Salpingoeca rosetta]|uniref:Short-chain dehydrogenase/reductase SDR n=1 Tax=Salpingoeca rosetta (strain ATCC 50818 / BSB-021) TaxID=946362 RepID=F2UM43_SALR5|nr:short-chain dehydrogenase/reductase SDR [Salpingoeca rosetta]EGD78192.1 short-chain dehydrogenase/reductase SDR [Salpingoeca rosetta]|eukprot:XP_004989868.1 short-chain dehydrogenase/reductase SDR [Salpingoeca rosetta]
MPTALITGASRGIGLELAHALASRGYTVIPTARTLEKAKGVAANGDGFVPLELDVESDASVDTAAERTKAMGMKLDVLINNAGVFPMPWSQEVFDKAMNVNLRGPVRTMRAFAPLFTDGARVINVSSGYGRLTHSSPAYRQTITNCATVDEVLNNIKFDAKDETMKGTNHPAYKISKACLNRVTQIMADDPDFRSRNIKVFACCPGWVRTQMGGPNATRSIAEGAASVLALVEPKDEHVSGGFYRDGEPISFE